MRKLIIVGLITFVPIWVSAQKHLRIGLKVYLLKR